MKLWVMSDLHLESTAGWDLPPADARPPFDVLFVAGDLIPRMERGVRWLAERVPDRPVIYVAGNHEFWRGDVDRAIEKARSAAVGTTVRILQDETTIVNDVLFAGATLWTDYDLMGDRGRAMDIALVRMNDHRRIRTNSYAEPFLPSRALKRHGDTRRFLEHTMRTPRPGKLFVVTHHAVAPDGHRKADASARPTDEEMLEAAYRSDLTAMMSPAPDDGRGALQPADLWIFGHMHESVDRIEGQSHLISNAKGYGPWKVGDDWQNPGFDIAFTIEI